MSARDWRPVVGEEVFAEGRGGWRRATIERVTEAGTVFLVGKTEPIRRAKYALYGYRDLAPLTDEDTARRVSAREATEAAVRDYRAALEAADVSRLASAVAMLGGDAEKKLRAMLPGAWALGCMPDDKIRALTAALRGEP